MLTITILERRQNDKTIIAYSENTLHLFLLLLLLTLDCKMFDGIP